MGKLPTKNQLIMISFALRLSVDKRLKLFELEVPEMLPFIFDAFGRAVA